MNHKRNFYYISALVIFGGLLIWFGSSSKPLKWRDTAVECLPAGHQNLALHFHPHLSIKVDGREEPIPTNIGISEGCMAEVHTHDDTGTIHIEATHIGKIFYLKDFLDVWGVNLERPDFSLSLKVDGSLSPERAELILKDKQRIELFYTRVPF